MSGVRGRGSSIGTQAATRPGRGVITATTSDSSTASLIAWVTSSVVTARACQMRCSSRLSRCLVMSSSAPNGSSSSSTFGSTTRERAIATRWRMPPDSWAGRAFSNPSRPTSLIRSCTADGATLSPEISSGSRMLAATERQGSSALSWNAIPRWCSRRAAAGGSPCTRAVPAVGVSRSARIRSTVDLPHPEGPRRDRNCPSWLSRSTPSSATTLRRPSRNSLRSPDSDRPAELAVAEVSVVMAAQMRDGSSL